MSCSVTCDDGPLAGAHFDVPSCPDPVRCVRSSSGVVAILDQPGDAAEPDETVYWYAIGSLGHACQRSGRGRGCHTMITLRHLAGVSDLDDARRVRQLELAL